jgi:hypothetical protein
VYVLTSAVLGQARAARSRRLLDIAVGRAKASAAFTAHAGEDGSASGSIRCHFRKTATDVKWLSCSVKW